MRQTLGEGIRQRLERWHGLNAESLERVALLACRLLLRLRAIAALLHHCDDGHREKTGVSIERQQEIDHRQRGCDEWSAFHS